ncbi:MAG: molybdopterin cofactor-binding domain-containing protein [Thermomicrobiales bacterium]
MSAETSTTPASPLAISRRGFIVAAVGGFSLGFFLPGFSRLTGEFGQAAGAAAATTTWVNAWIQVGTDESITVVVGSAEMGQGALSGLPQIVAEELMVDYTKVSALQASASQAYVTGGSSSVRSHYLPLRQAGAAAREMLVQAAMNQFGDQTRANVSVDRGVVTHTPSGRRLTYGQLAAAAAALPVPAVTSTWPPLVPDSQFKLIGQSLPRLDIPAKVDGSAIYGLDVRVPGMVYAVIKHCPSLGGTLAKAPATPSGAMAVVPTSVIAASARGSEVVGATNAVAVVADTTWNAWQAARRLQVSWTIPASSNAIDSAQFQTQAQTLLTTATPYASGAANPPGTLYTAEKVGDAAAALSGATKRVEATYTLPYVAHACMEVLNCTVNLVPGVSCEVWAPTQAAGIVLSTVQALTGLAPAQITVHTTFLGGGLGRKIEQDFIAQAVQVAKAIGKPVKLMWPREEDFGRDQYRPMALVRARAGLDGAGNIAGWHYRNVSPSISAQRGRTLAATGDSQGTEGSNNLPYAFASRLTEYVTHPAPVPVGYWRSVGSSINAFAVESMIDELALAAGKDPYQFRRTLLAGNARWLAVLDAAANLGGWNTPVPSGRARGIAIATCFNSIVAEVVEISQATSTSVKVHRVSCAIDCGRPVNPNSIEAQMQGGIVHGLNAALWGQVTFSKGMASAKNFRNSRMLRLNEMPQIAVTILPPNPGVPVGGVGEPGVPPLAPALANAYAKLTGTRPRSLPLFPGAQMSGL